MLSGLHHVQNALYDAKDFLGQTPLHRNANHLSDLFNRLQAAEDKLAQILEDDWWERN